MIAHTQLLERNLGPQLPENCSESLNFVIDAAGRMQNFIERLLTYAQLTHVAGQVARFDSEAMLERTLSNLAATISDSGAEITHEPLPEVMADPALEQVFQNLISNAIKYRRAGVSPKIHISARTEPDGWVFAVGDNGVGIDERQKENIFRNFPPLAWAGDSGQRYRPGTIQEDCRSAWRIDLGRIRARRGIDVLFSNPQTVRPCPPSARRARRRTSLNGRSSAWPSLQIAAACPAALRTRRRAGQTHSAAPPLRDD